MPLDFYRLENKIEMLIIKINFNEIDELTESKNIRQWRTGRLYEARGCYLTATFVVSLF